MCDKFNLYSSDQFLCPLCLEWFVPLPRPQDCILEYILPTNLGRAGRVIIDGQEYEIPVFAGEAIQEIL
ncbi:hypothetical protein EZJ55_11940 [Microcystis aeruginosa EAWAG127a]|uniref:Uncharacterized protein n=1 Tax=Microcystis aeruginosa EAWAG127a TaxID=2529855 RepID=A0A5J5M074_MICAE|nr:hypothetical protein EZJ55_11940 [Microcystis aeruginosa EAWAG127a]NCS23167.1 hypothetical protein [Microcystis aeruginosa BS13-02]